MKKILFLSDVDISSPGGAQESMKILMDKLSNDYEFYLLAPEGERINENHIILEGFRDFILRGKGVLELLKLLRAISNKIKKINPDVIHIQMPSTLVLVNLLIKLNMLSKEMKIIYTDRGVYGKYGRITTRSIDSFIRKTDLVVTTTQNNKDNYKNKYKEYNKYVDKFKVIPNTAGEVYEDYNNESRVSLREKYGIASDLFVVGFCGRYGEQKNWPLATQIMDQLSGNPKIMFLIVIGTDGTYENQQEVKKYLNEIEMLVGKKRVLSFVDIPNKKMSDIYYMMDSFILTSKWESFGRTAIEAMSRKNIVLGTSVDGITEVIGDNNFIFNTPEQAVKILNDLLGKSDDIKVIKEKFHKRYLNFFGYERNVQMYNTLYQDLLD